MILKQHQITQKLGSITSRCSENELMILPRTAVPQVWTHIFENFVTPNPLPAKFWGNFS